MAAGTARLAIGYTLLGLGVLYFLSILPLFGFSFSATGGGSQCGGSFFGGGTCQGGGGSVSFSGFGWFFAFPGFVLVAASIPLIITGHVARADERRAAAVEMPPKAP